MWTTSESLAVVGLIAVIAVLLLGLANMTRQGKEEVANSDTLMFWRVATQAAVILALLLGAWLAV